MSAEVEELDGGVTARHRQLLAVLARGVAETCCALWAIRAEQTYRCEGFESFGDFVKSLHYSLATGRLWANCGPLFDELRKTGEDILITHPDVLKPIALLLSPQKQDEKKQRWVIERQAQIIRTAIRVAKNGMEPLTQEVVARVAKKNFGILPTAEYRAQRKAKQEQQELEQADDIELAKRRRERLELAFATILDYDEELRRSSEDLAELRNMIGFERALLLLVDARDA